MWYVYIMKYYSAWQRRKSLHLWKMANLESIMLSEMSQRETNPTCCHLYMESEKAKLIETVKWQPAGTGGQGHGEVSVKGQTFSCKISRLWRSTNMVLKIIRPKRQQWLLMTNVYESSITSLQLYAIDHTNSSYYSSCRGKLHKRVNIKRQWPLGTMIETRFQDQVLCQTA